MGFIISHKTTSQSHNTGLMQVRCHSRDLILQAQLPALYITDNFGIRDRPSALHLQDSFKFRMLHPEGLNPGIDTHRSFSLFLLVRNTLDFTPARPQRP